jgi:RimJ/RimL family protein N-acetyltransferase/8-oxo-dGTP pyrophosphatase MutT (NUDIX family)
VTEPPGEQTQRPELTDGVVLLRPWREEDVEAARAGHDDEIAHWLGLDPTAPPDKQHAEALDRWREGPGDGSTVSFVVEAEGRVVGTVQVHDQGNGVGDLWWTLYAGHRGRGYATRAVRLLVDYAIEELGLSRLEARVEPGNERSLRVATRAGLRREGVQRVAPGTGDRPDTTDYVVLARLATDPPLTEPHSFRALLNSFLPRKRAIAQMLLRDPDERVLLCQLTYKQDWDLPGGVVEVHESPQLAVTREIEEELALDVQAGSLLLTDWLPSWSGWDDAICLVFDGGVHDASLTERVRMQPREIRSAEFCTLDQVRERCADFTARRVEAALARIRGGDAPPYTESGRPV